MFAVYWSEAQMGRTLKRIVVAISEMVAPVIVEDMEEVMMILFVA